VENRDGVIEEDSTNENGKENSIYDEKLEYGI
jgi:hypothetical protein